MATTSQVEQRTIIDQIEIRRDGTVQVRLDKQILRDGKVINSAWHRAAWEPGTDFEGSIEGVNASLVAMGEAEVDAAEWDRVRRVIAMEQSADVIAAYRAERAAEAERMKLAPVPVAITKS